jgi:hypothetical protein
MDQQLTAVTLRQGVEGRFVAGSNRLSQRRGLGRAGHRLMFVHCGLPFWRRQPVGSNIK